MVQRRRNRESCLEKPPYVGYYKWVYHQYYNEQLAWVGTATREGVAALPPGTPLFGGLFVPWLPPQELVDALSISRSAGAAGVSLFEMGALTDEHLARLQGLVDE